MRQIWCQESRKATLRTSILCKTCFQVTQYKICSCLQSVSLKVCVVTEACLPNITLTAFRVDLNRAFKNLKARVATSWATNSQRISPCQGLSLTERLATCNLIARQGCLYWIASWCLLLRTCSKTTTNRARMPKFHAQSICSKMGTKGVCSLTRT